MAGWTVFSSGAGADQSQRNNVAALAMISPVMMRLIPGRRYGVLPPPTTPRRTVAMPERIGARRLRPERRPHLRRAAAGTQTDRPYAMSDSAARFATVSLDELLAAME